MFFSAFSHTQKSETWTSYSAYVDWTKLFLVSFSCHCIRLSIGDYFDVEVEMMLE